MAVVILKAGKLFTTSGAKSAYMVVADGNTSLIAMTNLRLCRNVDLQVGWYSHVLFGVRSSKSIHID